MCVRIPLLILFIFTQQNTAWDSIRWTISRYENPLKWPTKLNILISLYIYFFCTDFHLNARFINDLIKIMKINKNTLKFYPFCKFFMKLLIFLHISLKTTDCILLINTLYIQNRLCWRLIIAEKSCLFKDVRSHLGGWVIDLPIRSTLKLRIMFDHKLLRFQLLISDL